MQPSLTIAGKVYLANIEGRHDTQHNNIHPNDTMHNDILHNNK